MISFWEQRHSIQLRKLLKNFLESQIPFGAQILASENNVSWYLQLGLSQARDGDPHLVWEEDDEILSFIQFGGTSHSLEFRTKSAEIFTMYTVPKARGRFLSIHLIREAGEIIAKKGYERVYSTIMTANRKELNNMFHNPSIWPMNVICEWRLENDAQFEGTDLVRLTERQVA